MAWTNRVVLEFGDGEFVFALGQKHIEQMQMACALDGKFVGIGAIYQRMELGVYAAQDIYHTIRLGLEGGGMDPVLAKRKADAYAIPPYRSGVVGGAEQTAIAVMRAAMYGLEHIPPGEAKTPEASSTSGKSEQGVSSTE